MWQSQDRKVAELLHIIILFSLQTMHSLSSAQGYILVSARKCTGSCGGVSCYLVPRMGGGEQPVQGCAWHGCSRRTARYSKWWQWEADMMYHVSFLIHTDRSELGSTLDQCWLGLLMRKCQSTTCLETLSTKLHGQRVTVFPGTSTSAQQLLGKEKEGPNGTNQPERFLPHHFWLEQSHNKGCFGII